MALNNLPNELPMAVRYLLQEIEIRFPGATLEVRVPPFGAIQCLEGLEHRRGTPPNVVEIEPELFVDLALGKASFGVHANTENLSLSGVRAAEFEIIALQVAKLFANVAG